MRSSRSTIYSKGLASLFALALAISLLGGGYSPSCYAQAPSPRLALEERIRTDVGRHLTIRNAPLNHADIQALYGEDAAAVGLSYPELIFSDIVDRKLEVVEFTDQQMRRVPEGVETGDDCR